MNRRFTQAIALLLIFGLLADPRMAFASHFNAISTNDHSLRLQTEALDTIKLQYPYLPGWLRNQHEPVHKPLRLSSRAGSTNNSFLLLMLLVWYWFFLMPTLLFSPFSSSHRSSYSYSSPLFSHHDDDEAHYAETRWLDFIDGKNYVIAQRRVGNDDAADERIKHLGHIALRDTSSYYDFSIQDSEYAQGALTLVTLEGTPTDRGKAMDALLRIARTDFSMSNHIADRRENLDQLVALMGGPSENAWRAAALLRSATIPDSFIDEALIRRLLMIDLKRQKGQNANSSTVTTKATNGIQEVFRWNVLNQERGTAVALTVLYDPATPKNQAELLQNELVAAGNEIPMRKDSRALVTFAPGLKRIDDERAADKAKKAQIEAKVRAELARDEKKNFYNLWLYFGGGIGLGLASLGLGWGVVKLAYRTPSGIKRSA